MINPPIIGDPVPAGYLLRPDYSRPALEVPAEIGRRMREKLGGIYGTEAGEAAFREIERLMRVFYAHKEPAAIEAEQQFSPAERLTEKDAVLIAYGDMIRGGQTPPLEHLARFAGDFLEGAFSSIHILPFFPYSSDRGFSVMDFKQVDPNIGRWAHLTELKSRFKLMVDLVLNHVSASHAWFQGFLNANPRYEPFFIAFQDKADLPEADRQKIVRPRTTELLTEVETLAGRRAVWTTFSSDQIDLNYGHWPVLAKIIETLLFYVLRGADLIRLDAVTYLWKKPGTACVHLPETHLTVKLMRDVLDAVAPHVTIITETNVPHAENITYFGDGHDEAQMVYNFALPPLLLYTFLSGSAEKLTQWVQGLSPVSETATFFNFMDSHDGIGLPGAQGILNDAEMDLMLEAVRKRGGFVSYRDNGDGTTSPYELNITCHNALNDEAADEPESLKIKRHQAARSIALALAGVPGIYLHGLLGSENCPAAVQADGMPRSINREALDAKDLYAALEKKDSRTYRVFHALTHMLKKRRQEKAFHPNAAQSAVHIDARLFALIRIPEPPAAPLLCLTNVSSAPLSLRLALSEPPVAPIHRFECGRFRDLLSDARYPAENGRLHLDLAAYEVLWLKPCS